MLKCIDLYKMYICACNLQKKKLIVINTNSTWTK